MKITERRRSGHAKQVTMPERVEDIETAVVERVVGRVFADASLLRLALTHRSYINENPGIAKQSNERLEFLGDSVLNFIVGMKLFELLPAAPEGELTSRRARVVKRDSLAAAAKRLDLGAHLVMGKGESSSGGEARLSNLANVFEAVCGAMFLDGGLEAASGFAVAALSEEMAAALESEVLKDPKSALQEILQSRGGRSPEYVVVEMAGPDHARTFVIDVLIAGEPKGRGSGRRKTDAERSAAVEAMRALGPA